MGLSVSSEKTSGSLQLLINDAFKAYDMARLDKNNVVIAFSGGKDSTTISLLLLDWIDQNYGKPKTVHIIHNDTLGEINAMELWAREFIGWLKYEFSKRKVKTNIVITTPYLKDSFFWRIIIRGYPPPHFKFRWCVDLLKINPTRRALTNIVERSEEKPVPIISGVRDSESGARSFNNKRKTIGCPLGPMKCHFNFFMKTGIIDTIKITPIRKWSDNDVWLYLEKKREKYLEPLFVLYKDRNARYGCWHCTLIRTQWTLLSLDKKYYYYEAARLLLRKIGDIKSLRIPKTTGYSNLGPFNHVGRAAILRLLEVTEKASKIPFQGLDAPDPYTGYTLREIFFKLPPNEADYAIRLIEKKIEPKRHYSIEEIRNARKLHWKIKEKILNDTKKEPVRIIGRELYNFDPIEEIISYI